MTQIQAATPEVQHLADEARQSLDKGVLASLMKADIVIKRTAPEVLACMNTLERGMVMADAITTIRGLLTDAVMAKIYPLMNTGLGFRTDRKPGNEYSVNEVREVMVEALLLGLYPIGNEFNIISGRCYVTREGYTRKVREFPGLTDLVITPGIPAMKDGGALVPIKATWKLNGTPNSVERTFPIKVNNGMGSDAILGKADRKVKAWVYAILTGSQLTQDGDVDDVADATEKASAAQAKLDALKNATPPAETKPEQPKDAPKEPAKEQHKEQTKKPAAPVDFANLTFGNDE